MNVSKLVREGGNDVSSQCSHESSEQPVLRRPPIIGIDCQQLLTDLDLALLPMMPNRVTRCIRLGDYFQLYATFIYSRLLLDKAFSAWDTNNASRNSSTYPFVKSSRRSRMLVYAKGWDGSDAKHIFIITSTVIREQPRHLHRLWVETLPLVFTDSDMKETSLYLWC